MPGIQRFALLEDEVEQIAGLVVHHAAHYQATFNWLARIAHQVIAPVTICQRLLIDGQKETLTCIVSILSIVFVV